jgi:ketosteroid isomerase-like protein
MSEENLEVVRRSVAAFETDEEAWLETIDPSMEWYPIEEGHTVSRGHDGARRVRKGWLENWDDHRVELEEVLDGGDNVVAALHISGRGKASGVEVDLRIYMHWKVRDGKLVYLYEYADRAEALRAAGLSE